MASFLDRAAVQKRVNLMFVKPPGRNCVIRLFRFLVNLIDISGEILFCAWRCPAV
jgi:hypothetical protein